MKRKNRLPLPLRMIGGILAVTQIFMGHTQREHSPIERLIDAAEDFDIRLFPQGATQ